MSEWFNNTKFWENMETFMFSKIRTPEETDNEIEGIINLVKPQKNEKILDLACGVGRITLPLARLGYQMTGVDLTPAYLKKLGATAKEEKLPIEIFKEDMRRFNHPEAYDVALSIFSSFSYFADPHHDLKTLENVKASLRPRGRFLLDVKGREVLKRSFRSKNDFRDEATGTYMVEEATISRRWDWIENKWTLVRGQHQKSYKLGIRIYSGSELVALLKEAGFNHVSLYGNFDGGPYDAQAERLIALATL